MDALSERFFDESGFRSYCIVLPEEILDKVKAFGETDAFPSSDAKARWIWPEFTRLFGLPVGGQPLCQAASSDEPHRPRYLPRGLPR